MPDDLTRWLVQDPATLPPPPPAPPPSADLKQVLAEQKQEAAAGVRDAYAAYAPPDQVAREAAVYGLSPEQAIEEMERGGH